MGQIKLHNFFFVCMIGNQPLPITNPGTACIATSLEMHLITIFPRGALPKWEGRNTNN